jgi:hypothetical protein
MKKIWLMGGFGNVLFQILVFNVISKTNKNVYYVKKLTEKNLITKCLGWTIHQELYNDLIEEKDFYPKNLFNSIRIVIVSFLSKIFKKKFQIATFYNEYVQIEDNISNNVFGYFQDFKFLNKNKSELLILGEKLRNLYAYKGNLCVVHYRRGDSEWAIKFSNYYLNVRDLLKNESRDILIVTDSLEEAKIFFSEVNNTKIISSKNALDDFKHLVSAKKLYCAPSTFSWWAAHSLEINSEIIMPSFFNEKLGIFVKNENLIIL